MTLTEKQVKQHRIFTHMSYFIKIFISNDIKQAFGGKMISGLTYLKGIHLPFED